MTITPAELKATRESLGMSQAQIAEEVGATPNTWAMWERGVRPIGNQRMLVLALAELRRRRRKAVDPVVKFGP